MVYRFSEGNVRPGPAAVITEAMVEGLAPAKFKNAVLVQLQQEFELEV